MAIESGNGAMPSKVRWAIVLLVLAAVCQIAVPATALATTFSRHTPIDETGRQIMVFLLLLEGCAVASNVTSVVLMMRRQRAARVFGFIGLIGLLPLALLGIALGAGVVRMLISDDVKRYLSESVRAN